MELPVWMVENRVWRTELGECGIRILQSRKPIEESDLDPYTCSEDSVQQGITRRQGRKKPIGNDGGVIREGYLKRIGVGLAAGLGSRKIDGLHAQDDSREGRT